MPVNRCFCFAKTTGANLALSPLHRDVSSAISPGCIKVKQESPFDCGLNGLDSPVQLHNDFEDCVGDHALPPHHLADFIFGLTVPTSLFIYRLERRTKRPSSTRLNSSLRICSSSRAAKTASTLSALPAPRLWLVRYFPLQIDLLSLPPCRQIWIANIQTLLQRFVQRTAPIWSSL